MEIIGIDVGFGFTKAYSGQNSVIFKSLIGDAPDIQFMSSMADAAAAANLHITLDNKTYFLGAYAERQSSLTEYTLDQEKMVEEFIKILALAAAGNGKICDRDLATSKLGVVDIGFKTTDFSIFDHLQYIERGSSTMDTGVAKCFSVIADKLRQESGVNYRIRRWVYPFGRISDIIG